MRKLFSPALDRENDLPARLIASTALAAIGFQPANGPINQSPSRFSDYDFVMLNLLGAPRKIEVERKRGWKERYAWESNWKTLDVSYRKRDSLADVFVMVNNPMTACAVVTMDEVKASPVITKDTVYTVNEQFFAVPLDVLLFMNNQSGEWRLAPGGRLSGILQGTMVAVVGRN